MIPLRDVIPSRTTPGVTLSIIALNTAAFVFELARGRDIDTFLASYGLVPARFSVAALFTSMFLHGGFLHFGGNMLFLWIFGGSVEDRTGHGRFAAFYLLCGVAAALTQAWMQPASLVPVIGASGAIAGVIGAYFVLYPKSKIVTLVPLFFSIRLVEVPAVFFLGIWILLQFAGGTAIAAAAGGHAGGVAFWAHVAGFGAGAAAVLVFRRPERQRVEWWNDA